MLLQSMNLQASWAAVLDVGRSDVGVYTDEQLREGL
jgi:hypothetical protein